LNEETKNPTTAWRKSEIIDWLVKKGVPIPEPYSCFEDATVPVLRLLSKKYKLEPKYFVEEMVEKCEKDIKLLWLPVAHCELNPIELIWSHVKGEVARNNKTFKIKDVLPLCQKTLASVPVDLWSKCVQHVIKLEDEVIKRERIAEGYMGELRHKIIITLTESDCISTDSSSCYDSDGSEN
jgi:hypothetical protein